MELKNRDLTPRGPGAATMRFLAQAAFVDEYYSLPSQLGFFLSSVHHLFSHRRIASSSRFAALVVGLWKVQPSSCSTFQTCSECYLTPHSCSIRSATLHAVQRLVSYPNASGPRFSASRILCRSSSDNRGIRPARPGFLRPDIRDPLSCRAPRLADCRWVPTRRTTSVSWIPYISSFASPKQCFSRTLAGVLMRQSIQQFANKVSMLYGTCL